MKHLVFFCAVALAFSGCSDRKAEVQRKQDADAKARAEAARKEMEKLPKTFQTPDYFKKNEPAKPAENPPPSKSP
ncbi:MAG TPA: hypothetical protein VG936_10785 [Lacunisphaera sp.]|nr:hypothetical protein [Lacunisphaera sp.]